MAVEIKMPALSPTMETGTLATWNVSVGENVRSGDVIAEIETDKATMEVEAVDEGVVASILIAAGSENVAVGTVIALLAEDGEDAASVAAAKTPASAPEPQWLRQRPPQNPRQHLLKIQPQARSQRRPPKHRWRSP